MTIKFKRDLVTDVYRAAKRLEATAEGTPIRKRAVRRFRSAVNAVFKAYPSGAPKKGAVCSCPVCKIPLKSWASAVLHISAHTKHGAREFEIDQCPACRKQFGRKRLAGIYDHSKPRAPVQKSAFGSRRGVERHLQKLHEKSKEEFDRHVIVAATEAVFKTPNDALKFEQLFVSLNSGGAQKMVVHREPGTIINVGDPLYVSDIGFVSKTRVPGLYERHIGVAIETLR